MAFVRRISPKDRYRFNQRRKRWRVFDDCRHPVIAGRPHLDVDEDGILVADDSETGDFPLRMRQIHNIDRLRDWAFQRRHPDLRYAHLSVDWAIAVGDELPGATPRKCVRVCQQTGRYRDLY